MKGVLGLFQGSGGGAWSLKMLQGSMMKYQRSSWSEVLAVLNEVQEDLQKFYNITEEIIEFPEAVSGLGIGCIEEV